MYSELYSSAPSISDPSLPMWLDPKEIKEFHMELLLLQAKECGVTDASFDNWLSSQTPVSSQTEYSYEKEIIGSSPLNTSFIECCENSELNLDMETSCQKDSTKQVSEEHRELRRKSHNATEKRRREKINDNILELKQLLGCSKDGKAAILRQTLETLKSLKGTVQALLAEKQALQTSMKEIQNDLFNVKNTMNTYQPDSVFPTSTFPTV